MADIDLSAFPLLMEQMQEFFLRLLDELKEAPTLPQSVREALPQLRAEIPRTFDLSKRSEDGAAKAFVAAVPTVASLTEPLTEKERADLLYTVYHTLPRVLDEFLQHEEFQLALKEFTEKVILPALAGLWLKTYFDFLSPDDIRIKDTRIGIESVLYEAIHRGQTPKQIARRYRTLSLEQVYAVLLYYERNKEEVERYLADYLEYCRKAYEEFLKNPPPLVNKLRQFKAEREALKQARSARA